MAKLIILSGLPATGKSAIARVLATTLGAQWLRVDTIEQALRDAGATLGAGDAGYRVAQAVAAENLRLGRDVIADSVNPWMLTRDAWRDLGARAGAQVVEFEIVCSDLVEHRRRVETRTSDVANLSLPDWNAVSRRDYHPWTRPRLTLDTARRSVAACVAQILATPEMS